MRPQNIVESADGDIQIVPLVLFIRSHVIANTGNLLRSQLNKGARDCDTLRAVPRAPYRRPVIILEFSTRFTTCVSLISVHLTQVMKQADDNRTSLTLPVQMKSVCQLKKLGGDTIAVVKQTAFLVTVKSSACGLSEKPHVI